MPILYGSMAAAFGRVGDFASALLPAERPGAQGMAAQRLATYSSGRRVAREALRTLGLVDCAVPRRGRAPVWPPDVVGSIAHSRRYAVAIVARRTRAAGVGVDLESENRVGARVALRVLGERERAQLAERDWRTMLFSAKEAVYKAVNPVVGEYLAFRDVALVAQADGTFTAATTRLCRSTACVASGQGAFLRVAGHWLTAFVLPASGDGTA